jgi:hypothetical protein
MDLFEWTFLNRPARRHTGYTCAIKGRPIVARRRARDRNVARRRSHPPESFRFPMMKLGRDAQDTRRNGLGTLHGMMTLRVSKGKNFGKFFYANVPVTSAGAIFDASWPKET